MTILVVALKYLRGRLLASALTSVSVALGVGLVIASLLVAQGIKEAFVASATDYNLVVGAKGSPAQLVLAVVFRVDVATPNIEYTVYEALLEDPRVELAVPMMVGDAYQGFRYVATNGAYFAALPWRRKSNMALKFKCTASTSAAGIASRKILETCPTIGTREVTTWGRGGRQNLRAN